MKKVIYTDRDYKIYKKTFKRNKYDAPDIIDIKIKNFIDKLRNDPNIKNWKIEK
jgi:hypothetical protein